MKMEKRNGKYHMIYFAMIIVVVLVLLWASLNQHGLSLTAELSEGRIAFDDGWTAEDGREADMLHLNGLSPAGPYQETSVYHRLPSRLEEGTFLCFRSKNIFYKVYVDGELRYEPTVPESPVYNDSLGTRWNYVPIYQTDAGKNVEVRFYTVYNNSSACMDHLYLGQAAGEILSTFSQKIVSFITCMLLLFVGFFLIVADIPINMQKRKNHELLYLGMFAVIIAVWCLAETNLFQFFTNDSRLLQLISCCSLMLIPIPMVLYLDAAFGFRRHLALSGICYLSAAEFAVCTVLHLSGVMDYHDSLILTHIILVISALTMLIMIIKNTFVKDRGDGRNLYRVLRGVGLAGLCVAAGIDILRHYWNDGGDSALFMRIGILIFILCYGISSMEKTMKIIKRGFQADFVSQLAYRDGLTGIGNRTAFQERLAELEGKKDQVSGIGIVIFDVNDLKYVNDHMGHQAGDDMLVSSALLIKEALEPLAGSCYRIGGDEFAVILSGSQVGQRCKDGLCRFTEAMEQYNAVDGRPYRIHIASGYAVYDKSRTGTKLMDIYQIADERMYENKKKMKEAIA